MRAPSLLPFPAPRTLLLCFAFSLPAVAQTAPATPAAPANGVTSEDLIEAAEAAPAPAAPSGPAGGAADPLASQELAAEQAFMDGDLPRALGLYRELAGAHPALAERSRLRATAAWLEFQLGNAEAANRELTATLVEDPTWEPRAGIYSPEFMALFQNAQRDATQERGRLAARLLKQGVDALTNGDTATARSRIEESLSLAPGSLRAIFALAQVDLRDARTDAALAGFERVLALERGTPDKLPRELKAQALNNIGVIYFERAQFEDAAQALDEASRLASRDPRVWFNLGLARQKLGLGSAGLDALRTAHELDRRDPEIASELGRAYIDAARWMEAVAVLLEATQAHPESPTLWQEFASAQRGLGNLEGMTTSLERAIELDPANSTGAGYQAAMDLAQAALDAKNFGQAIEASEVAVRMRPDQGSAWALLGVAQRASGRLPEAAQSLERAVAVAPDRADIVHNLGTVYLAQRRYPEAETAFSRAIELDPAATESAAALNRLAAQRQEAARGNEGAKRGTAAAAAKPAATAAQAPQPAPVRPKAVELGAQLVAVDYPPLGIRGLLVESIVRGGLAELSGLLVDDLVLRAGGRPLTQPSALTSMLASSASIPIQLSVLRAGKPVEVVLRAR